MSKICVCGYFDQVWYLFHDLTLMSFGHHHVYSFSVIRIISFEILKLIQMNRFITQFDFVILIDFGNWLIKNVNFGPSQWNGKVR